MAKEEIKKPINNNREFEVSFSQQSRMFNDQQQARDWAIKLLEAGVFYMKLIEVKKE